METGRVHKLRPLVRGRPVPRATVVSGATLAFVLTAAGTNLLTTRESAPAKQYLADCGAVATASMGFQATATTWIDNPAVTGAEASRAARPLIVALESCREKVPSQKWPKNVQHDMTSLLVSFGPLLRDLDALSHANFSRTASWEAPLLRDYVATSTAANRVRHDLGLAPLAT